MIHSPRIHYINSIFGILNIFKNCVFAKKQDLVGTDTHQLGILQLNRKYSTFTIGQTRLEN